MDSLLDTARFGPSHLKRRDIALIVRGSIQHCAAAGFDPHSWVIMPNHVHLLFTPHSDVSQILRRLKGYTARQANQLLRSTGQPSWQDESYERLVRSREEFRRIESYILTNPVKAGLAASVGEFPWSSAAASQD